MKRNEPAGLAARTACALGLAALLAACGILPKKEPTSLFEPARPAPAVHAEWPQANWSLLVARPVAGALLDNDRIAVRPAAGEVSVYKGSSWTDTAPEMVQNALLRRFEDSGKILSVSRPGGGVRGQYQLQTDLRAFESVYVGGAPEAQVEIYARLVDTASGEVVAARSFRETQAAAATDVDSVVQAVSAALGRASEGIAGWALQAGNASEGRVRR
jgi:cholesterol transport system auxiliary component